MATNARKRALVVTRHSPYGGTLARSALDVALAAAAFDQPVDLLFMGDGVLQLLPAQAGRSRDRKDMARQLAALPLYDIDHVYADAEAAVHYGVELGAAPLPVRPLEPNGIRSLMQACDLLLGF